MDIIDNIKSVLDTFDKRKFYLATGIFVSIVYVIHGIVLYRFYTQKSELYEKIDELNTVREKQVLSLLIRAKKAKLQKSAVESMLKEKDDEFKINEYMELLINNPTLNLKSKCLRYGDLASLDIENGYIERTSTAEFGGITMIDVTSMLELIEKNSRVYTKEIDISTSKRLPRSVDVIITIATIEQKK